MLNLELATVRLPAADLEPNQPIIPLNNLQSVLTTKLFRVQVILHMAWYLHSKGTSQPTT